MMGTVAAVVDSHRGACRRTRFGVVPTTHGLSRRFARSRSIKTAAQLTPGGDRRKLLCSARTRGVARHVHRVKFSIVRHILNDIAFEQICSGHFRIGQTKKSFPPLTLPFSPPLFRCAGRGEGAFGSAVRPTAMHLATTWLWCGLPTAPPLGP